MGAPTAGAVLQHHEQRHQSLAERCSTATKCISLWESPSRTAVDPAAGLSNDPRHQRDEQPCPLYLHVVSLAARLVTDLPPPPAIETTASARARVERQNDRAGNGLAAPAHCGTKEMTCRWIRQGCIIS